MLTIPTLIQHPDYLCLERSFDQISSKPIQLSVLSIASKFYPASFLPAIVDFIFSIISHSKIQFLPIVSFYQVISFFFCLRVFFQALHPAYEKTTLFDQLHLWLVDKGKRALWNLTNGGSGLDRLENVFVKLHVLFQTVKPSGKKNLL